MSTSSFRGTYFSPIGILLRLGLIAGIVVLLSYTMVSAAKLLGMGDRFKHACAHEGYQQVMDRGAEIITIGASPYARNIGRDCDQALNPSINNTARHNGSLIQDPKRPGETPVKHRCTQHGDFLLPGESPCVQKALVVLQLRVWMTLEDHCVLNVVPGDLC